MSKREMYEQKTEEILLPIVEEYGFELVDVEYVKEGSNWLYGISVDAASSATPLMDVKEGGYPSLLKMFLGTTTGTIGETSTAALLLGAIYLLLRRVIDWKIPVIYIATFAVFDILYMVIAGAAQFSCSHIFAARTASIRYLQAA